MKQLLILCLIGFVGCNPRDDGLTTTKRFTNYDIVVIDGCEYLKLESYYGYFTLTHKGNCNNQEHNPKSLDDATPSGVVFSVDTFSLMRAYDMTPPIPPTKNPYDLPYK